LSDQNYFFFKKYKHENIFWRIKITVTNGEGKPSNQNQLINLGIFPNASPSPSEGDARKY
jgi:hypothetical protein